jgi:hypothetical protein
MTAVLQVISLGSLSIHRNPKWLSAKRLNGPGIGGPAAGAHAAPPQGDRPLGRHGAHPSIPARRPRAVAMMKYPG